MEWDTPYLEEALLYLWNEFLPSSLDALSHRIWELVLDISDVLVCLVALITLQRGERGGIKKERGRGQVGEHLKFLVSIIE